MPSQPTWNSDIYAQLREMASAMMSRERLGHTLGPTALTHEVWLKLLQSRNAGDLDQGAFMGLAAQAMRRILTDHARSAASAKRGGDARRTTLSGKASPGAPEIFALDLDAALVALQATDDELSRIVELSFYGGASIDEVAQTLRLSPSTVKRRLRFARAWLQQHMLENES